MWETFISWYLNTYLGRYVENLNSQQLTFALRQGELELENVPLKKNIFRSWGLPVEVRSGVVGRIKIEFNLLKYFRNEPVLVSLEDIYLVAGSLNLEEWDPLDEEAIAHEAKMSSLDAHEGRWKAQYDLAAASSSYYSSLYFSSVQIGASIVTKVVENLQLNVRNVHIRFEEEIGSRTRVVAFGVTLESLIAQSCDSSYSPLSSSSTASTGEYSFKTVQLIKLGVYCDTRGERFSKTKPHELKEAMKRNQINHDYLLCPVSAEARIAKNNASHPLSSTSKPRFEVFLVLEKVPLKMNDSQYRNSYRAYKSYTRLHRNCRLRHYRPFGISVKENPSLWWKYGIRAVLAVRGYRRRIVLKTWEEVIQRAKDNVAYVHAYELHLRQQILPIDMRRLKDRVETEMHYDEIVALRSIAMSRLEAPFSSNVPSAPPPTSVEASQSPPKENSSSYGLFSYLFPSWSSSVVDAPENSNPDIQQHSPSSPRNTMSQEEFQHELLELKKSESELDEAILDDVKSFGRDALLAKFEFILKKGQVTLTKREEPFLEFDFCGVDIKTELRPRSGSHKLSMTLESLFLRDCLTKCSIMCPHTNILNPISLNKNEDSHSKLPIFKLYYERKPNKKSRHRITVTTKPLDLVLYPRLWEDVGAYFDCTNIPEDTLELPSNGYEAMKEKTKEELRTYWERLINAKDNANGRGHRGQWEINFDISAPQIIIHSSKPQVQQEQPKFRSKINPYSSEQLDLRKKSTEKFLVIDLGRFRFTNNMENPTNTTTTTVEELKDKDLSSNSDEDEFVTPCSSPVPELENQQSPQSQTSSPRPSIPDILNDSSDVFVEESHSLIDLQTKLYKKYKLEITDVQLIVVEGKSYRDGSWKSATTRCTSLLHLVDRFSIDLQVERRLVYSEDPRWPALTFAANLPKLNLHFNESKLLATQSIFNSFFKSSSTKSIDNEKLSSTLLSDSLLNLQEHKVEERKSISKEQEDPNCLSDCKLFVTQFTIQSISVEIQSKGRSIAELQITGARTTLTKRKIDTNVSFVIQSLLLADAIQTYGPDFELLLASHKHVCMDSVSGSLMDSDPTSPMSPQSPSSPMPFAQPSAKFGAYSSNQNQLGIPPCPTQLHDALLTTLQSKRNKSFFLPSGFQSPIYDREALITAELVLVHNEQDDEDLGVLSVQCNNLDVIANQDTIMEIYQFVQKIKLTTTESNSRTDETHGSTSTTMLHSSNNWKLEASFDFNRLNVLLLRGVVGRDGNHSVRKIATATAVDFKVGCSLGSGKLGVQGSLGGLQVLNLTPEGSQHQRALSIGKDPLIDPSSYNVFSSSHHGTDSQLLFQHELESALDFNFDKTTMDFTGNQQSPTLTVRMASLIYVHCPIFLIDLKKCFDQFQTSVATRIKSAAAQIAFGLVRQDTFPSHSCPGFRSPSGSFSGSLDRLNMSDITDDNDKPTTSTLNQRVQLDVVLDSPVIVLPKSRTSPEVLVGNLGKITINGNTSPEAGLDFTMDNSHFDIQTEEPFENVETRYPNALNYNILITDISLYSINLKDRWSMLDNLKMTYSTSNRLGLMKAKDMYYCDSSVGRPILHNTVIQVGIDYIEEIPFHPAAEYNPPEYSSFNPNEFIDGGPKLEIHGRVINPLKVSIIPQQYAQLLDSLNNIAASDEDFLQRELKIVSAERKLQWEKQLKSPDLPLPSPTVGDDETLTISATFDVSELNVELVLPEESSPKPKLSQGIPHLSLSCSELSFECDKKGYMTDMKISLKSLTLEDTNAPLDSHHRLLASSQTFDGNSSTLNSSGATITSTGTSTGTTMMSSVFHSMSRYVSTSCPDLIPKSSPVKIHIPETPTPSSTTSIFCARTESSSLPDHLDPNDIFTGRFYASTTSSKKRTKGLFQRQQSKRRKRLGNSDTVDSVTIETASDFCPITPPPSPRPFENMDNLVQIQMVLVDPKSPNFITKYKGTHKFTDVDFNTLDVLLTPSTFICLRQFFSDASKYSNATKIQGIEKNKTHPWSTDASKINLEVPSPEKEFKSSGSVPTEDQNTETQINVKALCVRVGDSSKILGEGQVVGVSCHIVHNGSFVGVDGRLGSLQIRDLSKHAGLYPVKFIFQGKQALDFDYYRKDNEAKFRLEMASIVCVHTNRFYKEFTTLMSQLFGTTNTEQQDELPPAQRQLVQGSSINKAKLYLNIQAGAPVLLFPYSSVSKNILLADLGHISIKNKFIEGSSSSSQNARGSYNCISIDLMEMDLCAAEVAPATFVKQKHKGPSWTLDKNCIIVKSESSSSSLLKNKCALNLKMKLTEGNADGTERASTKVEGTLSTLYGVLDVEKYKLIRGLLQYNIGEQLEEPETLEAFTSSQNSKVHHDPLDSSSTAPIIKPIGIKPNNHPSAVDLAIELDLVNVSLDVQMEDCGELSRIDFVKSKFTLLNYSDGSRDIDLASQEIMISDTRFKPGGGEDGLSKNVFTNILQQSLVASGAGAASTSSCKSETFHSTTKLQAELHLRETARTSNFTILLNNMRLMLIVDWWMEVQKFLTQHIPEPEPQSVQLQLKPTVTVDTTAKRNISPVLDRSKNLVSPVSVSAGIVSKRAPVLDVPPKTFEFKINVSDCELVAVEDSSVWDTNAVILKVTSALTYRPHLERPISCTIITCELFSCILGLESETALSILDPTSVTLEVIRKTREEPQGILDAALSPAAMAKILKIQSPQLNLRLSYYDMKMFIQFLNRFSKQAQVHLKQLPKKMQQQESPTKIAKSIGHGDQLSLTPVDLEFNQESVDQLLSMGFSRESVIDALSICAGRVEDAALMLSSDSPLPPKKMEQSRRESNESSSSVVLRQRTASTPEYSSESWISGIEVKCSNLSFCVIDDCKDADVPLLELNVSQLEVAQNCCNRTGSVECILGGDYYNRELCGWEPFLEPWKCNFTWKQNLMGQLGNCSPSSEFPSKAPRLELNIGSRQVMDFNITSTLLSLYSTVSSNWSAEYSHQDKRRAPFVPFALKNETGSTLWFSTVISNHEEVLKQQRCSPLHPDATSWIQVQNGHTQTFSFEGRGKLRHRNTHQLRTHQLAIRVNGWEESSLVSVDRVGTFFRNIKPLTNNARHYGLTSELPTTRLVFEVNLQGSAQKLIRIRSALMVKNSLPETMELKLENTLIYPAFELAQTGGSYTINVKPNQTYPIPLHSVCAQIWLRPIIGTANSLHQSVFSYSPKPLHLDTNSEGPRSCCCMASNQIQPYRFCIAIKRDEFPIDTDSSSAPVPNNPTQYLAIGMSKRANLITILSPLTIVNLLPYEVNYEIREHSDEIRTLLGGVRPGNKSKITNVDTLETLDLFFNFENFRCTTPISLNFNSAPFVTKLKLIDINKRPLFINVKIVRSDGGSIRILLSCQYWIVNKSGLPIVIKQEGTSQDAAGQFQEHEHARMVSPLLFSFSDSDSPSNITLRIGNGLHPPPAKPHWCRSFSLQNGTRVRKLVVAISHSQPELVYLVGVEVKDGRGKYCDSKIISIAPRFVIENRSSRYTQISQRNYATSFLDPAAEATHLTLPPECTLPFHWPRLDKDQLLCVRLLNVKGTVWSGGFPIESVDSFHLTVRDADGNCYFLRIETILEGPTYFVVFSDTDQLPPPFRIDNLSLVPILFHQTNVGDERCKLTAKASSSCPYAWDEPTQPSNITLSAPGGTSAIANMNTIGLVAHLTYENFFYIALTATFPKDDGIGVSGIETLQLVLDVEGSKVVLKKKDPGNRNQLWRVNADGLIEHEGTSPPRDPKKSIESNSMLVLDIAGQASQPTQWVHLQLRKPDKRRACTQHWEFTKDGRLKCALLANMFVQAKDGFGAAKMSSQVSAWQMWNDVVLGPPQPICYVRTDSGIPAEQAIARQKLRPGSGRLSVYVDTDGPTRVLRIIDTEKPPRSLQLCHTYEDNSVNVIPNALVTVDLHAGLGVSIINCKPREELIYIKLTSLHLKWLDTKNSESLNIGVQNLQVDNQLFESEKSVVIYVTPVPRYELDESSISQPALQLSWKRLKSRLNAHVFKDFELGIKPLNIILEEKLLLKLCTWSGLGRNTDSSPEELNDFEVPKALTNSTLLTTKRFYFGALKLTLHQVRLSVLTSSKLSTDLAATKRRLGLTLIRFEEALVELDPFYKLHPFETFDFLLASLIKHYKDELLSQALLVLGSVDFLGNPVGFVNDVSMGVSGLIHEGSIGALFKNVTHGLSNSAAKVTGSLGDGLTSTLTLDGRHEEERRRIREDYSGSSVEHIAGGIRGLSHGVFGGLTSIISQTYEGVVNDGLTGLVTGLGKGIVGTVTKPAVGVLDLAAGAASAIRDSARTSSRIIPKRNRLTRVVTGNGGLLPPYSEAGSRGQDLLYELNDKNYSEIFIGCETVRSGAQDLKILVSSEFVTVFKLGKVHGVILQIPLRELLECRFLEVTERGPSSSPAAPYEKKLVIEFVRRLPDHTLGLARPQVIVDTESVARRVVQEVNYARILYEEMRHSQINVPSPTED